MNPNYSVVVPVYNEEPVILETHRRLSAVMVGLGKPYEIIYINDGSRDAGPALLAALCGEDSSVRLVNFARNFGHQAAVTAGLQHATGRAIVIIDADLQDPPELIPAMLDRWREGYDVVYGQRRERVGDSQFKKLTAFSFYRTLRALTDVNIPVDTGDFRLIDASVRDALMALPERNRFMRGMVSWVGFKQTPILFDRDERWAGETKYPLRKMVKLAVDGILSFSYKPLKVATFLGCLLSVVGFVYLIVVLCQGLFGSSPVSGWASTMAVMLFFDGVTLLMLGIMGEYIGRIYEESKARPLYIVRDTVGWQRDEVTRE